MFESLNRMGLNKITFRKFTHWRLLIGNQKKTVPVYLQGVRDGLYERICRHSAK